MVYRYRIESAHSQDQIPFQTNAFELFGYDLMMDSKMKMWLIEVNSSPSMGQEHLLDEHVTPGREDERLFRGSRIVLGTPVAWSSRNNVWQGSQGTGRMRYGLPNH